MPVTRSLARRPSRRRRAVAGIVVLALVTGTAASLAVATDTLGARDRFEAVLDRIDRFMAGPVPDRPTLSTVLVDEDETSPQPSATAPLAAVTPGPGASVPPTPTPLPKREPVDVDIADDPEAVFKHEIRKDWCAPAGVQMVLAQLGLVDTSDDVQRELAHRVREWEAYDDSHNGEWGPAAIGLALDAYGAPGYEVRAFKTRNGALRDAARAIQATGAPAVLLTWRGAHTWVMTGFRADADPSIFRDARITGTYILDPWYPWVSTLWGPSDPPGTFQDEAEMERNFLRWDRPEGRYADRDGLYITVVPTAPASEIG
jgi:hypothetical protein